MDWLKILIVLCLLPAGLRADEYQLLHFGATWCGPCRTMDEHLKHKDVVVAIKAGKIRRLDIDVDVSPQDANAYKVDSIPAFILVRVNSRNEARVLKRKIGLMTAQELAAFLKLPAEQKAPPVPSPKKG